MSAAYDASLSLIERKKLQWAREKEELAALDKHWNLSEDTHGPLDRISRGITRRRSSLPPLYKNQYNSNEKHDREKEIGGETSGYGSDNPNHSPDYANAQSGYESSSSRDDRMKWIDKSKYWQSKEESFREHGIHEPPNWVKRGLKGEEIVFNNTSPAESPEQRCEEERSQIGSSCSRNRNTFLRGQNIPVDSVEMAERERRRQIALAHQDAIRKQLEERERKRREENERRIREEHEEELRIEREQEIERRRREEEYKLLQDKLDRERKRKEAIEEAIELAKKEALLAKTKKNIKNDVNKIKNMEISKNADLFEEKLNNKKLENIDNDVNNNLEVRGKSLSPRDNDETKISSPRDKEIPQTTPRTDNNVTLIIPGGVEKFQYALLIPNTPRIEARVLTPTQYRENKKFCDCSTQTEESVFLRTDVIRKERRSRSENLEERPKWGVNRPPTRYVKQSEKDLLYQKRKLRQKSREEKNSSDESQLGSPTMTYRKKGHSRRSIRMIQTENIPLETDRDHIYYKRHFCCCMCRCSRHSCSENGVKVDILRIDDHSPREKSILRHEEIDKLPELDINLNNMEKLDKLRNGLLLKREQWEEDVNLHSPQVSTS